MRGAWRTTWLLLAFMVVNFADKAVLGLAGPEIRADFGITRAEFGTAQSAFFALFSVAALGVAALTKRIRTTPLLLVLALLWSAAQLPMVWDAAGFGALVATRVLLGAAEGPASPVAMHHVHGWFPQRERTLPTAVLLVGAAIGVAVASPVLSWVISHQGWRWSFGVVGLVGLVWAVAWRLWGSEGPLAPSVGKEAAGTAQDPLTVPLRRILLSPTFLTAAFGSFAAYWSMSTLLTWAPDYLESVVGWDLHRASTMVGAGALANGAVLLVHGLLSRRAARRDAPPRLPVGAGAGILVTLAGCATAVYGTTDSLAVKVPMMMGPMALAMVMLTVAATACSRIAPPSQRGVVLGVLTFVYALGGILSPLVLGAMVDSAATVSAGYEHGWLLTSGLLVTGGVLAALFCRPERTARKLGVPETSETATAVPVAH
ncbi:MFS transporter [Streptomyces sp. VRA16 Mangrove soil]|uniref:MFS transporter n=1 Tax=Streptomyces sp. VRA16 Mangrove soil TaxID=2817434 RepID=UPI001E2EE0D3|nr:MFS transporter [Streptomyces sp. VRA16 Mangrove soil]